jgi:hypothetical protein
MFVFDVRHSLNFYEARKQREKTALAKTAFDKG